jgi:hypothetical protein
MHFAKCSVVHSKTSSIKIGETNGWILFWVLTRLRQKSKEAEELANALPHRFARAACGASTLKPPSLQS